jgi:probable HAF family extracellular repeat protein
LRGAILPALAVCAQAKAEIRYAVTIIEGPSCGSVGVSVGGLSDRGHVTGWYATCGDPFEQAFLWVPGAGLSVLPLPSGTLFPRAHDVDDDGLVVGNADLPRDGLWSVGFVHDGTHPARLGTLPGGDRSEAAAVNERGEIAGHWTAGTLPTACLWRDGRMIDLGPILASPRSKARDIADSGAVVGWMGSLSPWVDGQAFLLRDGVVRALGVPLGASSSSAEAVNERGEVVGWAIDFAAGRTRAFYWHEGVMIDLGFLPGCRRCAALDIDDRGRVVGCCWEPRTVAFIWEPGARILVDLNDLVADPDVHVARAEAINASGWIAGTGEGPSGPVAIVLTPLAAGADLDGDGTVGISDLIELLARWGACPGSGACPWDLDGDSAVGGPDLALLLSGWG